jgi:hypothetical protein
MYMYIVHLYAVYVLTEYTKHKELTTSIVPDRRRRIIPEVILVRRWVFGVLEIWRGGGVKERVGQGRSVYKQPKTEVDGSCHS